MSNELKTHAPEGISYEHLFELAKMCGLIGAYSVKEINDQIVGYARVVLNDGAVQEAFLRANGAALSDAAQAPLPVAWRYQTPTGWHATTDSEAATRVAAHHEVQPLYATPVAPQAAGDAAQAATIRQEVIGMSQALKDFEATYKPDSKADYFVGGYSAGVEAARAAPVAPAAVAPMTDEQRKAIQLAELLATEHGHWTLAENLRAIFNDDRRHAVDPIADEMDAVAIDLAHRMALELECVLVEATLGCVSSETATRALDLVSDYRTRMNAIHERVSPTFMGEPVIPPKGARVNKNLELDSGKRGEK